MVRDNWDGIKTIQKDKKRILLENLSPEIAGTDIQVMAQISMFMIYLVGIGFIIDRLIAIVKILRHKSN